MDFFGGGGTQSFDWGATSSASGGANDSGDFNAGVFNNGSNEKVLIGALVIVSALAFIAIVKK